MEQREILSSLPQGDRDAAPSRLWTTPQLTVLPVHQLTEAKGTTHADGTTSQNLS